MATPSFSLTKVHPSSEEQIWCNLSSEDSAFKWKKTEKVRIKFEYVKNIAKIVQK